MTTGVRSREGRSSSAGARSTRSPSVAVRPLQRRNHREKARRTPSTNGVAHRRRPGRLHAPARRLRLQQQQHVRRRTAEGRQGRGCAQPDLLGRLRRTGMDQAVRTEDRLQGQRQGSRHLRRNGRADEIRAVRRRLGVGQRHRPPRRRRRLSTRSTSASSPTTRRSSATSRTSRTTPSKGSITASRTAAAPTC